MKSALSINQTIEKEAVEYIEEAVSNVLRTIGDERISEIVAIKALEILKEALQPQATVQNCHFDMGKK